MYICTVLADRLAQRVRLGADGVDGRAGALDRVDDVDGVAVVVRVLDVVVVVQDQDRRSGSTGAPT